MTQVLLLHHAQGLTPGVIALADRLRAAGHTVHAPDSYDGLTFADLESGMAHVEEVGFQELMDRGVATAAALPAEVVYLGISLGVMPAQFLAQSKPGALGAILIGSAVPPEAFAEDGAPGVWPSGVPLQIHATDADPVFVGEGDIEAAQGLAEGAGAELFLYPGDTHLFIDSSLSDYLPEAAELATTRILALLDRLS